MAAIVSLAGDRSCISPLQKAGCWRASSGCYPKIWASAPFAKRSAIICWNCTRRQDATNRFDKAVFLNLDPNNLASYDSYYQYHDPITFKLQARREATLVTQVMPQRELMRTEFFNDFLARDGLHWGVNAYSFVGDHDIGDVRI